MWLHFFVFAKIKRITTSVAGKWERLRRWCVKKMCDFPWYNTWHTGGVALKASWTVNWWWWNMSLKTSDIVTWWGSPLLHIDVCKWIQNTSSFMLLVIVLMKQHKRFPYLTKTQGEALDHSVSSPQSNWTHHYHSSSWPKSLNYIWPCL